MLIALRRVKHSIIQAGGVMNFPITQPLLTSVKMSRARYELELKSKEEEKSKTQSEMKEGNELLIVEDQIKKMKKGIEVADKAISDGSMKLEKHLAANPLDQAKLQADNALIQMGLQRKKKLNEELAVCNEKRAKLRKLAK